MTNEQFERMKKIIINRFQLGLSLPECHSNCKGKYHNKPWGCYDFLKTAEGSCRDKMAVVIIPSSAFSTKENPSKITHILKDIDSTLAYDLLHKKGLVGMRNSQGCEITECCELWQEEK